MNILSGFIRPDKGEILVNGKPVQFTSPNQARLAGVDMVHQHFQLVPQFTVAENLMLPRLTGFSQTLAGDADILIFDEPTAALSDVEIDDLLQILRKLASNSKTVIFIAHKLNEVAKIADDITVLALGKVVSSVPFEETTMDEVARWMLGKIPESSSPNEKDTGEVFLSGKGISVLGDRGDTAIRDLDIEVHAGEIMGIGGVDGNGQIELAEALAGVRPVQQGQVSVRQPLGYVPQDRQTDGLALEMTVKENLLLDPFLNSGLKFGPFLRHSRISSWAHGVIEEYQVKLAGLNDTARNLSGGNQQKVVVARSLDHKPRTLIVVNPTRGLDFRSTEFVHEKLLEVARMGSAILLISTDNDELRALSNRTLYLASGRLYPTAELALLGAKP
jgi:simple sugar transport system ATP-binding protein